MPPLATWFGPRDAIETFLRRLADVGRLALEAAARARQRPGGAGLLHLGPEEERLRRRSRSNVLTFRGERISDVTAFIIRTPPETDDREVIRRMPEQPATRLSLEAAFENFGVPDRLD